MKSQEIRLMEWLYEHNYEQIHEEWFQELGTRTVYEFSIIPWIKEKYPEIWENFEESQWATH